MLDIDILLLAILVKLHLRDSEEVEQRRFADRTLAIGAGLDYQEKPRDRPRLYGVK